MNMSKRLKDYLGERGVNYQLSSHPRTGDSAHTAKATHVPGDRLAKAVMLEDERGYVMAVIPSTHRVSLGGLHRWLNRRLGLATESELQGLFPDCELGAIPPVGRAYGLDTLVDEVLFDQPEIWFDAGDHEEVVRVSGHGFRSLMAEATPGRFSTHS